MVVLPGGSPSRSSEISWFRRAAVVVGWTSSLLFLGLLQTVGCGTSWTDCGTFFVHAQSQQDLQQLLNWAIKESDPEKLKGVADGDDAAREALLRPEIRENRQEILDQIFQTQPSMLTQVKETLEEELVRWRVFLSLAESSASSSASSGDVSRKDFDSSTLYDANSRVVVGANGELEMLPEESEHEKKAQSESSAARAVDGTKQEEQEEADGEREGEEERPANFAETEQNLVILLKGAEELLSDPDVAEIAHDVGIIQILTPLVGEAADAGRLDISEHASWAIGSMVQNNFPAQKKFLESEYGPMLLAQKPRLMADFESHPRLLYAFSALLRGGNPKIIHECKDLLVASYQQLREQYEGVRDGGMIPQKLVKRILGFLTAINSLEIYNVDSMEEMKAKRDELHNNWQLPVSDEVPELSYIEVLEVLGSDYVTQYVQLGIAVKDVDLWEKAVALYKSFRAHLPHYFYLDTEPNEDHPEASLPQFPGWVEKRKREQLEQEARFQAALRQNAEEAAQPRLEADNYPRKRHGKEDSEPGVKLLGP